MKRSFASAHIWILLVFGLLPFVSCGKTSEEKKLGIFLDKSGDVVVPEPFREGMAAIRIGEKWGFMNNESGIIIPPQYSWVSDFYNGCAMATP